MSDESDFVSQVYELKVKDFMKTFSDDTPFVEKNADVNSVFPILNKESHVWVVENKENLQLLGVITESDVLSLFSPPYESLQSFDKPTIKSFQYGLSFTVDEIMSKKPLTISIEEKIVDVLQKMKQHKIKQLPVVDENNKLLGEISIRNFIDKYNERQVKTV
jgi:predicted transcriptional regulator